MQIATAELKRGTPRHLSTMHHALRVYRDASAALSTR
jgi:hypothetical protein